MLKIRMSPSLLLSVVYGTFIILGAILLKLPISNNEPIRWIDSLFTSASAMTVTGLGVVDTGTHFTRFGQIVIMVLIQVGGLGIMSFAMLLFVMLRKKIGLKQRLIMKQALNQVHVGGVIRLVKYLFLFSILIEVVAMVLLAIEWIPKYGVSDGLFYSFFHSVSAFNNAGFALWSDGLSQFVGSPVINLTIMSLIILGGIGFTVIVEVWQKRKWRAFSLHTKVMIQATIFINVIAAILFFGFEQMNPKTIGMLSGIDQTWASLFQAVTTRTAGFNSIDISGLENSTAFLFMILMFIGGGSGSTAGGIKLTTFVVMLVAMLTYIRGRKNIHLHQRTIHQENVLRVLAITMISTFTVAAGILVLNVTEPLPFLPVMFEVVSAFGTVGLSMGITAKLSIIGKLIIIVMMIIGKLGPLSLVYMLARQEDCKYRYPNEDILTG
ncbi:trk system potassium uptake protein TrkH [Bacillus ectoiniformans]|uniref:TrkH family potassium uptake protein n=1 Tax=Bacillus ectoiniformans TaxID=1494429 RepID=UPI001EF7F601|nr:TrkH family potassium uptake protein [Bacillus ectoiniformans]MBM7647885.1 trk system potassium uptake protein TrkH [Bacillus ectoiniformans]